MDDLLCIYLNARSLINKFKEFDSWIAAINPDIVGITETWEAVTYWTLSSCWLAMTCFAETGLKEKAVECYSTLTATCGQLNSYMTATFRNKCGARFRTLEVNSSLVYRPTTAPQLTVYMYFHSIPTVH